MSQEVLRVNDDEIDISPDQYYLYKGEPFTGIACVYQDGELVSETSYVNGMEDGVTRGWYENGGLSYEVHYQKGVNHGLNREWDERGLLRKESVHEMGIRTELKEWDASGCLTNHFAISDSDPDYGRLQSYRASAPPQQQLS